MIVAVALVLGAVLIAWAAPAPLTRWGSAAVDPATMLTWWMAVLAAVSVSAVSGAAMLLMGSLWHVDGGHLAGCWALLGHSHLHPFDELAGGILLAFVTVAVWRAVSFARQRLRSQRRAHRAHVTVLNHLSADPKGVLWLTHDRPFAYSIPGRPSVIVASTALARLPETWQEAVLHHERHHLRRRHHLLIIAVRAARHAMPGIPLFRRLPSQVEALAELTADSHASRTCGPEAVRGALGVIDLSGRDAAEQRVRHLDLARGRRFGARVVAGRVAVCLTWTATPPLAGAAVLGLLAAFTC